MPLSDTRNNNLHYQTGEDHIPGYASYPPALAGNIICSYCLMQQSSPRQLSTLCHQQHYYCSLCMSSVLQYQPVVCPLCVLQATMPATPMVLEANACQPPLFATASANNIPATNGTKASPNNTSAKEDYFHFDSLKYNTCPPFAAAAAATTAADSDVYLPATNAYQQQTLPKSNPYLFTYNSNSIVPVNFRYACIKLSNIPWDISQNDVRSFFWNCQIPSTSNCIQSIHIMMDRNTGKTLSDAYVEFSAVAEMRKALSTRNQRPLKGRIVTVTESSQEELLRAIFPRWRGRFYGNAIVPPSEEIVKTMSTAAGGGTSACPPFITREEINSILVVCKNYKLHFSKKCAERPFENIISIIAKYPWHQAHLITVTHRDHVYEMLCLAIEALKMHITKDCLQLNPTLMERLVRAGIMCPAFTEVQKAAVLQTAQMDCPQDILHYMLMGVPSQCVINHSTCNFSPLMDATSSSNFFGASYPCTPQPLDQYHFEHPAIQQQQQTMKTLQPYYQSTAAFYQPAASTVQNPAVSDLQTEVSHLLDDRYDREDEDADSSSSGFEPDSLPFSSLMIDIQKCSSYSADYRSPPAGVNVDRIEKGRSNLNEKSSALKATRSDFTNDHVRTCITTAIRPSQSYSISQLEKDRSGLWTSARSSISIHGTVNNVKATQQSTMRLSKRIDTTTIQGIPLLLAVSSAGSSSSKASRASMSTWTNELKHASSSSMIASENSIWKVTPAFSKSTAAKN